MKPVFWLKYCEQACFCYFYTTQYVYFEYKKIFVGNLYNADNEI